MAIKIGTIDVAGVAVGETLVGSVAVGSNVVWQKASPVSSDPLCFTAEEANSTIRLDKSGNPNAISLETSTDGTTWTEYGWTDRTGDTLTMTNIGDKVYFRAKNENTTIGNSAWNSYKFVGTGSFGASGNIQSLLKADCSRTDAPTYCYYRLFLDCSSLTTAPTLPATTLASTCYSGMFYGCTSLTTAPSLSVTTLADQCYGSMFRDCTSLTSAPTLPATTLTEGCYSYMFNGCSSLTSAPALPAITLTQSCYNNMFNGCSSLTVAPELPATTLASNCYVNMFRNCTSLTDAPELPATTLASNCYNSMFYGCSSISSITVGFSSWESGGTNNWLSGVASTGEFNCPVGLAKTFGASNIPTGWDVMENGYTFVRYADSSLSTLNIVGELSSGSIPNFANAQRLAVGYDVTSIGNGAINGFDHQLTSVTLPEGLSSIGASAFQTSWSISSLTIPSTVTSIGDYAFRGMSELTSLVWPAATESIGTETLGSLSKITNIVIPEGVTSIGVMALGWDSDLPELTIPSTVTSIGEQAFTGCNNLVNVTMVGKEMSQVQGMTNYPWSLKSGAKIHCTDGDITIS